MQAEIVPIFDFLTGVIVGVAVYEWFYPNGPPATITFTPAWIVPPEGG